MSNCQRILQVWICFTPSAPLVNVIFILSILIAIITLSSLISVSSLAGSGSALIDLALQRIDEMIDIVELLCGEATFQGYELLQRDYDLEERAIGVAFSDPPH